MKRIYLLGFAILIFAFSNAQVSITGSVQRNNKMAIVGATISILNLTKTTATDKEGNFSITLPNGYYTILVSHVGYATQTKNIKVEKGKSSILNFILAEQSKQLEDVVVTANKKEEDIIKVATSVTSLSAKQIENNHIWGLGDLASIVPNYSYQELGVAYEQIQSIRGIQAFSDNPEVSTYVDDVNNLDILGNGLALTDIDRIEVLRGPQGTLFGRNAMGGVVNIITKKPTNTTTGFIEAGVGNQGLQRYSAGFKTPIIKDKLFFGFTGLFQTKDGYFVNDTTGTGATDGSINGKKLGGVKNIYGNLFLKWLPNSRLNFTLNVKAQRDWSDNSSYMLSQANDSVGFASPDKLSVRRIGQDQRDILNNSLVTKYFGRVFTLTSITAYQNIRVGYKNIDFPGFYGSFYDKQSGELLPPQEVYSQEIRINSTSDKKLQYTAGFYGLSQKGFEPSSNNAYELSASDAATFNLPVGSYIISRNRQKNYGLAGFGELNYLLTNKLKATIGIRYDYENKQVTFNGFGDAALINGVVTNFVPDTTANGTYSSFSPKLSFSYSLNNNSNVYVTYNKGFRAGGINNQKYPAGSGVKQAFDPEYSDNYELGYKTNFANHKVSIRASAFLIEWQNMQLNNIVAPFTYAIENLGNAQSKGIELEVSAIPIKGLQLDGSFGLDKTKYENFVLTRVNYSTYTQTTTQLDGNSLSNTPSHTIYFGAQYEIGITKKIKAVLHGDVRNVGKYYADMQNTLKQPGYTLMNSRIGFTYNKYSLFFWGQNLTNQRYLLYGNSDTSFGRNVLMSSPSTYGVTLSVKF